MASDHSVFLIMTLSLTLTLHVTPASSQNGSEVNSLSDPSREIRSKMIFPIILSDAQIMAQLADLVNKIVTSLEECSLVLLVDDQFLPFIHSLTTTTLDDLEENQPEKSFTSLSKEVFLFPQAASESELTAYVKSLEQKLKQSKKICSHYVFMINNKNNLRYTLEVLMFSNAIKLTRKFIIVTQDSNPGLLEGLEESDLNVEESTRLVESYPINKLVNLLYLRISSSSKPRPQDRKPSAIGQKMTSSIHAFSHAFFRNGRRLTGIFLGTWKQGQLLKGKDVEFVFPDFLSTIAPQRWYPTKMRDFERFQLKVSTFHYPPVVIFDPRHLDNPTATADGLEVRLLRALSDSLNFDFLIATPKDGDKWGKELPNGSWTGAFGEVLRGDADISFANFFITKERLTLVDMTHPYGSDYTCFITPMPAPLPRYTVVVMPFQNLVWVVIFIALIIVPVVLWLFSMLQKRSYFSTLYNSFWFFYGVLMKQSMPQHNLPLTTSLRLIYCMCSFAFLVLSVAYMSSLFSMLLLPFEGKPVNSLTELLQSGLQWGVRDSGGWEKWFGDSIDPTAQKISAGFQFVNGLDSGISRVVEGDFAFMNSGTYLRYLVASKFTNKFGQQKLHVTKECFVPFRIGLAVPLYSVYTPRFNIMINRVVEAGLVNQWFQDLLEMASKKQRQSGAQTLDETETTDSATESDIKVLNLHDLQGGFFLLLIGYFGSITAVVIEYMSTKLCAK